MAATAGSSTFTLPNLPLASAAHQVLTCVLLMPGCGRDAPAPTSRCLHFNLGHQHGLYVIRLVPMRQQTSIRFGVLALVALASALRRCGWRACAPRSAVLRETSTNADIHPRKSRSRLRRARPTLAFISVIAIILAVLFAFQLTRQPNASPEVGSAHLLVPGNPFYPSDRFRLQLVMNEPGSRYVEYHIVEGCSTRARRALLMLSGDARLLHPRYISQAGSTITEQIAHVSQPWFASQQAVEVFTLPLRDMPCPAGVSPAQTGVVSVVGGWINHSYENSASSSSLLQLPLIGDQEDVDTNIPALGGFWGAPLDLSVDVDAGTLPLDDQINNPRPSLTGSGGLSWSDTSFVQPSVSWVNTTSTNRDQLWDLLLGAVVGIFGSLLAAIVLDLMRDASNN
jgi:hypothetical protein